MRPQTHARTRQTARRYAATHPGLSQCRSVAERRAEASALLAETFQRVAGWWIEGAVLPAAALEADIDRAILAGDLDAARAALAIYEQAAAEACAARAGR